MLQFDPAKRIGVDEALKHPYMESLSNPEDEPVCENKFVFDLEGIELDKIAIQELIFQEMCHFHPDALSEIDERKKSGKWTVDGLYEKLKARKEQKN